MRVGISLAGAFVQSTRTTKNWKQKDWRGEKRLSEVSLVRAFWEEVGVGARGGECGRGFLVTFLFCGWGVLGLGRVKGRGGGEEAGWAAPRSNG